MVLITLCEWCHRAIHDGRLSLRVLEATDQDVTLAFVVVAFDELDRAESAVPGMRAGRFKRQGVAIS